MLVARQLSDRLRKSCNYFHLFPYRNSSIPDVDNIPCEKLSQEKDLIQSLIDKQVSIVRNFLLALAFSVK